MKKRGVEIRVIDLSESTPAEQLEKELKDIDTVISAVDWKHFAVQKPLIYAAKKAGVKRFIPCDWSTATVPGIRTAYDEVRAI